MARLRAKAEGGGVKWGSRETMVTICNPQKVPVLRLIITALRIWGECFTVCYGFVTLTIRKPETVTICNLLPDLSKMVAIIAKTIATIAIIIAILAIILVTQVVTGCNL